MVGSSMLMIVTWFLTPLVGLPSFIVEQNETYSAPPTLPPQYQMDSTPPNSSEPVLDGADHITEKLPMLRLDHEDGSGDGNMVERNTKI